MNPNDQGQLLLETLQGKRGAKAQSDLVVAVAEMQCGRMLDMMQIYGGKKIKAGRNGPGSLHIGL